MRSHLKSLPKSKTSKWRRKTANFKHNLESARSTLCQILKWNVTSVEEAHARYKQQAVNRDDFEEFPVKDGEESNLSFSPNPQTSMDVEQSERSSSSREDEDSTHSQAECESTPSIDPQCSPEEDQLGQSASSYEDEGSTDSQTESETSASTDHQSSAEKDQLKHSQQCRQPPSNHQDTDSTGLCDLNSFSDSDEDSDLEAHYLEEDEPQPDPGDPAPLEDELQQDPDDPPLSEDEPEPDPDDPPLSEDEDVSEDEDNDNTFSFEKASLNAPVRVGRMTRKRDVCLIKLANALKDCRTYESLIRDFQGFNKSIGRPGFLPECKKSLWSLIKRKDAGITKWAYGPDCSHFLGRYRRLRRPLVRCHICQRNIPYKKVKFFISLSLKKQFQNFLALPGVAHLLRYREWRVKQREDGVEDILDAELYQELQRNGVIGQHDYSYAFNSDGFKKFKHQSLGIWGLLVRLNELPPNLRQRNLFLAGIWIDKHEPNMNTFLRPFVAQANNLSQHGVVWRPDGNVDVTSKIIPLVCCVDAKARATIMNQHQFNGHYGCYGCTHEGVYLEGSMKYPLLPFGNLPVAQDRTDNSIRTAMGMGHFFQGQKGASEVIHLIHFDMARGNGMDDLHPFYEGVAKFYFKQLVTSVWRRNAEGALRVINFRMSEVKTPIQMARKWDNINNSDKWKGSQWGYFIRYFIAVLTLENRLPQEHFEHLSMLSYSLFVLSQDSIVEAEFLRAENYITRFLRYFQNNFGAGKMRYNIHMLQHVVQSRRLLGPAWTISTFNFESWNGVIGALVTAANGASEQIVIRHMLRSYVHAGVYRDDVPDEVKKHVNSVLFGSPRVMAEEVNPNVVVLGRPTDIPLSQEEVALLTRKGYRINNLNSYERVLVRGIEFRCSTFNPDTKSDNSLVKTWDDNILRIRKIVVFDGEEGRTCGMFVTHHEINFPLRYAHHVARLTGVIRDDFVLVHTLRVPAMQFVVRDSSYVVPMANCREID